LQVFALDGSWLNRLVILTSRAIFVVSIDDYPDEDGRPSERVMDVIPLEAIEFIGLNNNHEETAVPEAFATGKFVASTPAHKHLRGSQSKANAASQGGKKGMMSGTGSLVVELTASSARSAWNSVGIHQPSNPTPSSKSTSIFYLRGPVAHYFLLSLAAQLRGVMRVFGIASEDEDDPRRRRARAGSVLEVDTENCVGRGSSAGDEVTFEIRTEHDSYNLGKTYRVGFFSPFCFSPPPSLHPPSLFSPHFLCLSSGLLFSPSAPLFS